jgi:predicted Zn finger-like uncharacterized protein
MILTCPNCATRYTVKDAAMPPQGRTVRCKKCGHSWFATAPEAVSAVTFAEEAMPQLSPAGPLPAPDAERKAAVADDEPAAVVTAEAVATVAPEATVSPDNLASFGFRPETRPAAGSGKDRRLVVIAGWALLLLSILVLLWSAYRYREQVVGAWPRAASLYAWIGWPVRTGNLILSDVQYGRRVENHHALLVVSGSLRNLSGQSQPVPPLQVLLRDGSGKVLQRYLFAPPVRVLKAGERKVFHTALNSPSPAARHLTLKLAGTTD